MMYLATISATPELTIALLIAKAQAMVMSTSQEMYLVYFRAGKIFVHAMIMVVIETKKNISSCILGKPTFTPSGHRLIVLAIGQHDKHRRFTPRLDKRIVCHHYQRIAFTQITVFKILCDALSTPFDFLHFSAIMTFEIEVLQPFVDTRETRSQNGFHPMQIPFFLRIFLHFR